MKRHVVLKAIAASMILVRLFKEPLDVALPDRKGRSKAYRARNSTAKIEKATIVPVRVDVSVIIKRP